MKKEEIEILELFNYLEVTAIQEELNSVNLGLEQLKVIKMPKEELLDFDLNSDNSIEILYD